MAARYSRRNVVRRTGSDGFIVSLRGNFELFAEATASTISGGLKYVIDRGPPREADCSNARPRATAWMPGGESTALTFPFRAAKRQARACSLLTPLRRGPFKNELEHVLRAVLGN